MNKFACTTETQWEEDVLLLEEVETAKDSSIVLFNDDVNTFDFVIESLIKYCGHDPVQAEQCTYLVHYAGKCEVKRGIYEKLVPICSKLLDLGLSAEIQ